MLTSNSLTLSRLRAFILPLLALLLLFVGVSPASAQSCDWEEEIFVTSNISGQVMRITGRGTTTINGVGGGSGEVSYSTQGGGWNIIDTRIHVYDMQMRLIYDQPYSNLWTANAANPPPASPLLNVQIVFTLDDGNEQTTASVGSGYDSACLPPPCQTINNFSASATTINLGQSITFTTSTPNAASATITDLATGQVYSLAVPNGSLVVSPATTRTYRLTAEGTCAPVTQDITITVNQPPTISSVAASPPSVCAGSSATLTWASSGGTSASITDLSTGTVTPVPVNGSLAVTPASTRTYRLTVTNGAGSVTQDVTVTVTQLATADTLTVSANPINAGQSTTLNFTTSNASSATITDLTTGTVTPVPANGSLVVTPATTRTYRLTATSSCGSATLDLTVTVNQPPTINTFSASASSVCAGSSSNLSWTSSNGASATITDLTSGVVTPVAVNGNLTVTPATTRTYRLTVTNGAGSVTQDLPITVIPLTVINSYSATATTINTAQSTTLLFDVSDSTLRSITDLTTGTVTNLGVESGSLVVTPATTSTYRLIATSGCNSVSQDITITVNQPPVITNFSASTSTICAGAGTNLSWTSTGGDSASITDLTSGTVMPVAQSGTLAVSPATSRTYRLTVTNIAGSVTQDVSITVTPLAIINSYSAAPTTVNAGQSTTLSFNVSNTTSRTITDLQTGTVTSLGVENSALAVTPASTRTYRLTATSGCNTVTQDIIITVTQPPTINTFTSTSPVCAGSSSTLSWTSAGGTSATITDLATGTVTSVPVNGSLAVAPVTTRTYRLTVTNGAGSVTQDVSVTVTPLASADTLTATATTINAGQSTTLSWTTGNATSASITDLATGTVTNVAVNGSLAVTPATTRTYRLTATSACGSATRDIVITVIQPPVISTFTSSISPVCPGGASTLSWSASGGTSATISAPGLTGSPVSVNPNSGTLVVNPASSTVYTLTVTNGAGSVTSQTTVTVTPATAINTFAASPSAINAGQSSSLSWTSSNGTSATVTDLTTGTVTNVPVNGSLVVTPPSTRTYRLTINGTCGTVTQDVTVTVTQLPIITSFTASASTICAGQSTTLSWASSGGTTASVTDLTSGVVTSVPVNGSLVVTPPSTRTYRLTVTNAAGSVTSNLLIAVNPLAAINSYSAAPMTLNPGQSSTLSYIVSNSSVRSITDLSTGVVTNLGTESGTLVVTPASTRTYRLTATSGCNTVTQEIVITVLSCQAITSFTASPPYVTDGQSTTLSWATTGATSATITNQNTGVVTNVTVPNGSMVVAPTISTSYILTAYGACAPVTYGLGIPVVGDAKIGPQGNPLAVGPDDLTIQNVPFGTTQILFNNTIRNTAGVSDELGFNDSELPGVHVEVNLGNGWQTPGADDIIVPIGPNEDINILVRVTIAAGVPEGTVYNVVLNIFSQNDSSRTDTTVDRVVIAPQGSVLIGPAGQPGAVGPTGNMDDYTNMTLLGGVAVPFGGVTTAGGTRIFTNTINNPQSLQADTYTISAPSIPAGFIVEANVGSGYVSLNGGATNTVTIAPLANYDILVRITAPSGIPVLTGYSTIIRATSGLTPSATNETIDRLWTGFVRADKSQIITNSTGVGGPADPVRGATIEYVLLYSNVTATSGTNNVNLTATNVVLTEDGNAAPNNWATTTDHVPASATDSLGGTITGDVAGSSLLTDTLPSLAPGQSGTFVFKRTIR